MVHSNERKLALSGWLLENNSPVYCSPLRLQKYLFFYEAFCKTAKEPYDFSRLKGYIRGPVFSPVWGDYTKERDAFDASAAAHYHNDPGQVNEARARKAAFLVGVLSEAELSELTHRYNIWSQKSPRILAGEQQVELDDADFNAADTRLTQTLEQMYPDTLVKNSSVIPIGEKYFVLSNTDRRRLTEQHMDILSALPELDSLSNPIFVEIEDDGGLLID